MFFNTDILYNNGPLALVWLAGNDDFRSKNKRNKELRKALRSNITVICNDLRALFPRMGTAYGINLKKMATLVNGAGMIFFVKMKYFEKDVLDAKIGLRRAVLDEPRINMPRDTSKSNKRKSKSTINPELPDPNATVFGEIPSEQFGLIDGNFEEGFIGTPRALPSRKTSLDAPGPIPPFRLQETPSRDHSPDGLRSRRRRSSVKRRREEDSEEAVYQDVLERLRNNAHENQRAHLMIEEESQLMPSRVPDEFGFENEQFCDGQDLLIPQNAIEGGCNVEGAEAHGEGPELIVPSAFIEGSTVGPPTDLELDSRFQMQTPPRAGAPPENIRKRRGEDDALQLEEISVDKTERLGRPQREAATRARRRLKLIVDEDTNMSLKELLYRVEQVTSETDLDHLYYLMEKNRAPAKSRWKLISNRRGFDFIASSGRPCPSGTLTIMKEEIMRDQFTRPECASLSTSDASIEPGRGYNEQSTVPGISTRSVLPDAEGQEFPQLPDLPEPEPAPVPGGPEGNAENDFVQGPLDEVAEEGQPPSKKRARMERQPELSNHMEGATTFTQLYPPGKFSKRRVALAFFALLKMQARKEISLTQEEPFGEIIIERRIQKPQ